MSADAKADARDAMKARRGALSDAARRAQSEALARFATLDVFGAETLVISGYLPIRDELDPRPLLAALAVRGHRLALPVMAGRTQPLLFRAWTPGDALARVAWGILEPTAAAAEVIPDLMLVPLLAIDRSGNRLGYGAGHYDRTIAKIRADGRRVRTIGLAFDVQIIDVVPHSHYDQPLDAVLTSSGFVPFT